MDIKRTILWAVFSITLLMLWDSWQRSNGHGSIFFPNAEKQQAKPAAPVTGVPVAGATATAPGTAQVPGSAAPAVQSERITITTDVFKADIDTLGGELKRLELLQQRDNVDPKKNLVLFDSTEGHTYLGQTGLIGGPFPNHKTAFAVKPGPRSLDGTNELKLVLEAEQGGVKLTKTFTFKKGDYRIGIRHDVSNLSGAPVSPSLYLQLLRDGNKPEGESKFYSTFTGPAIFTDADKFQKIDFDKIEKGKQDHAKASDSGWVALVQHYFVSAFIPPEHMQREIYTKKIDTNLYAVGTILPLGSIAPGATVSTDSVLYSGPQESKMLEQTAPGLTLVKDYGWLKLVAEPIFMLMTMIHKALGNWGWTIIALTILIKLAFFPLSAASYRSMAKMKKVTPRMQEIKERLKGDPQKMNQAMMELYKTEKINPIGGCLPVMVQIPVFIALYWVLLASVEMRNAPWIGWIHNLAAPDPFYILPVIMAVSMFIQTKLNPTPADPVQAKMMTAMPIIFSVMFFFFPAGLVLYWVVNNILSIAQQWYITKSLQGGKTA